MTAIKFKLDKGKRCLCFFPLLEKQKLKQTFLLNYFFFKFSSIFRKYTNILYAR